MTAEELFPLLIAGSPKVLLPNLLRGVDKYYIAIQLTEENWDTLKQLPYLSVGGSLAYLFYDDLPEGLPEMMKAYSELRP